MIDNHSEFHFYSVPFNFEDNKLIEDISDYLSKKTSADVLEDTYVTDHGSLTQMQFIKHNMTLDVKIPSSNFYGDIYHANYVSIQNKRGYDQDHPNGIDSLIHYYFIEKIQVLAENCLKLSLRLDVLNTLESQILTDTNWNPNTMVEREHRDRYFAEVDGEHDEVYGTIRVDDVDEGINLPLVKSVQDTQIDDTLDSKFYLVYRSAFSDVTSPDSETQKQNAIKCFLLAEQGKEIPIKNFHGEPVDIDFEDYDTLQDGEIAIFSSDENPDMMIAVSHVVSQTPPLPDVVRYSGFDFRTINNLGYHAIYMIRNILGTLNGSFILYKDDSSHSTYSGTASLPIRNVTKSALSASASYTSMSTANSRTIGARAKYPMQKVFTYRKTTYSGGTNDIPTFARSWATWQINKASIPQVVISEASTIENMKTIDELDRTDSRLVKVIELPYSPVNYTRKTESGVSYYEFEKFSTSLELEDVNADMTNAPQLDTDEFEPDFSHKLSTNFELPVSKRFDESYGGGVAFFTAPVQGNETKLLHSSFWQYQLFYDTSVFYVKMEDLLDEYAITPDDWDDGLTAIDITFTASSNIANGVMFSFSSASLAHYKNDNLYPLVMVAIRNNEVNLYNASYLNYIRSGYNYDVKAKSIALASGELSLTQNLGNSIISSVGSVSSSPSLGPVANILHGLWNHFIGQKQLILEQANIQNSINSKLAQTALQGTSVAGSDNLSLFNKYSQNKLHVKLYTPKQHHIDQLLSLFHLHGYRVGRRKLPNLTGRCFFNYVQCAPIFKDNLYATAYSSSHGTWFPPKNGMSEELQKAIIEKFQSGVFIVHQFGIGSDDVPSWNTSFDKENWELMFAKLQDIVVSNE